MGASMKRDHIKMRIVQVQSRRSFSRTLMAAAVILVLVSVLIPVINGLSTSLESSSSSNSTNNRESRKLFGGYRITPKFCKPSRSLLKNDPRAHGPTICMFNHECIQRSGVVVGACMDGFLFGTCCQLGNKLEDSILDDNSLEAGGKPTNAAISYETYGGSNFEDQNALNQKPNFVVPNNAVKIQSASPSSINYDTNKPSTYLPSPSPTPYLPPSSSSQPFSPELPTFISPTSAVPSSPAPTPQQQQVDYITENSLNKITSSLLLNDNLSPPFTHSDITHGEADAVILDAEIPTSAQFYGEAVDPSSDYGISSTAHPIKVTYAKPAFKPKPTKGVPTEPSTDKYVLVHTISNDKLTEKPPTPTNNLESIESIILMLNETKVGPQYSSSPVTTESVEHRETTTTTRFPSTSSINYDKYGPTSFYITTKLPAPTRSPTKPPRPHVTPTSPALTYTVSSSLDFQGSSNNNVSPANPTKVPLKTTTKPLVTSYISSTVVPKRPVTKRPGGSKKPVTKRPAPTTVKIVQPQLVTKQPTKSPVIITSTSHTTKVTPTHSVVASTPTVILIGPPKDKLTPHQPILSIVHEDTVQISGGAITDRPHPTVHITPKPVPSSTLSPPTEPPKIAAPSYANTPFVTKRPTYPPTAPVIIYESTPQVSALPDTYNNYYTPATIVSTTSIYTNENLDTHYYDQEVFNEKPTATGGEQNGDEMINFPPVRHPNLNMSGEVLDQKPLNTPVFIEDDKLNNKMNLLVSKIVASLQSNFEELEDIVNEPNVTTARPFNTRRPVTQTALTRRPTTTTARPPQRTTARPKVPTTTRKPLRVTTTTTTRRPTTRRPVILSTAAPVTTRKPSPKPTTRRPKPTRKPTTTTTEATNQEDEYVEEINEEEEEEPSSELSQGRILCGTRPQVKSGRIVGGKSAAFGEFPWQVLVRESTWLGLFTKNKCGGVLISKNYVVTAAHCQPGFLANLVAVFGEFDISGEFEKKRAVTKNVKRVIVHRAYDAATFENDLALLELESPIHFDTHIVPICMPPDTADFTGRMATVTGWGRLKYGGGVPSVLQVVQVPIIENNVCQEMFQTAGHNKKILESFLCAGYANGQRDSCEGDSGGPLVMQRPDGRWELAGTVSHGIKCAAPYLPGVYMRTTYYKPWLESITGVH